MKADELMIGSYVASSYGYDKPVIYRVDKLEDGCIRGSKPSCSIHVEEEHFSPILITPEILVRLGFNKVFNDVFQLHINDKEFEYCLEEDGERSFELESSSSYFIFVGDDCKYVHQIQKAMSSVGEKLVMGDL